MPGLRLKNRHPKSLFKYSSTKNIGREMTIIMPISAGQNYLPPDQPCPQHEDQLFATGPSVLNPYTFGRENAGRAKGKPEQQAALPLTTTQPSLAFNRQKDTAL
jgi:hypothetical protein